MDDARETGRMKPTGVRADAAPPAPALHPIAELSRLVGNRATAALIQRNGDDDKRPSADKRRGQFAKSKGKERERQDTLRYERELADIEIGAWQQEQRAQLLDALKELWATSADYLDPAAGLFGKLGRSLYTLGDAVVEAPDGTRTHVKSVLGMIAGAVALQTLPLGAGTGSWEEWKEQTETRLSHMARVSAIAKLKPVVPPPPGSLAPPQATPWWMRPLAVTGWVALAGTLWPTVLGSFEADMKRVNALVLEEIDRTLLSRPYWPVIAAFRSELGGLRALEGVEQAAQGVDQVLDAILTERGVAEKVSDIETVRAKHEWYGEVRWTDVAFGGAEKPPSPEQRKAKTKAQGGGIRTPFIRQQPPGGPSSSSSSSSSSSPSS